MLEFIIQAVFPHAEGKSWGARPCLMHLRSNNFYNETAFDNTEKLEQNSRILFLLCFILCLSLVFIFKLIFRSSD